MRILMFKMEEVAYASTRFFAETFGAALETCGVSVTYFDMLTQDVMQLEALEQEHFDAAIDFNSRLPGAIQDEKAYFLDCLHTPFFNYILDHPLYHHNNLEKPLKDYHVICIDSDHAAYVKKYYPHIKSVHTMPLGAVEVPAQQKKYDVLFSGTYLSPKEYLNVIEDLPEMMRQPVHEIIDLLLTQTDLPFEQAVAQVYEKHEELVDFPIYARSNFLADIYVRAYFREKVLQAAVESGVSIAICGEKYRESPFASYKNVTVLGQVPYRESLDILAQSKAVLNVMPWFKAGLHDRVVNAMANKTLCVTDGSRMLDTLFIEGTDYVGYSLTDMEQLKERLSQITDVSLWNDTYRPMVEAAYTKVQSHTFAACAQQFLNFLKCC